ncbi:hypothetical protein [Mesorhizobium sp. KR9-304]|uniref:hypothetical protein n=1 Tax=Mesorhizobium sp. KR9-304 TaxID=3156614 RepID=UPI0032B4CEC1
MRLLSTMALLSVAAFPSTHGVAAEGDIYRCIVKDFSNASDTGDEAFKKANLEKIFTISEGADAYQVEVTSRSFRPSASTYRIVARNLLQISAIEEGDAGTFSAFTIATEVEPAEPLEATIVVQAPDIANAWFLVCTPAN